jgi:hypothetical protein
MSKRHIKCGEHRIQFEGSSKKQKAHCSSGLYTTKTENGEVWLKGFTKESLDGKMTIVTEGYIKKHIREALEYTIRYFRVI